MTNKLRESGGKPTKALGSGIYEARLIQAGWGSSGYYSPDLLREYGPTTFRAGRPCFANHATESELANGRDVTKIMAKLVTDAEFREEDNSLVAQIKVDEKWQAFVSEYKDVIGMSIFASGDIAEGEAEGRTGNIVEAFDANDPYTSVDFVVAAGAGGKVERMLESYRAISEGANPPETPDRKDAGMTPEDIKAVAAALAEALAPSLNELREALTPAAPVVTEESTAATAAEVAEAVREANLSKSTEKRVFEALAADADLETVKSVIESEKKYAETLTTELTENGGVGRVHLVEGNPVDEPRRLTIWSN